MTAQPEHGHLDLRVPLKKFLDAVTARVQELDRESTEPSGHDVVLDAMNNYVSGALLAEAEEAGRSTLATCHIAHLALALVEQAEIPEQGTGSGPYQKINRARREVTEGLAVVWQRHRKAIADELEEIEHDIDQLPGKVEAALLTTLPNAVAAAVVAVLPTPTPTPTPAPTPTPVPTQIPAVQIPSLQDLAGASVAFYTQTPLLRIGFLEGAFDLLNSTTAIPTNLTAPINNVITGVVNFADPIISSADLFQIASLRQQIANRLSFITQAGGN